MQNLSFEENTLPYVGMGRNPEPGVPDVPLGLGMALMQDSGALTAYGELTAEQKAGTVAYVQGAVTGEDAKERIAAVVSRLKQEKK